MDEGDDERYRAVADKLASAKRDAGNLAYVFDTLEALARALVYKAPLGLKTRRFYKEGNKAELEKLANGDYKTSIKLIEDFYKIFKKQWYKDNKGFGFEIQAIRIGGLIRRLEDCREELLAYVNGEISEIEELEAEIIEPVASTPQPPLSDLCFNGYAQNVSTSLLGFN